MRSVLTASCDHGCRVGCGGDTNAPSPARTATIQVSGETYRIALTTPELVAAAARPPRPAPVRASRTAAS